MATDRPKPPKAEKRELFCHEYRKDRNATKAAIRAKYSPKSAHTQGWDLLQLPEVRGYIDYLDAEERKRANLTREDLVNLASEIVHADPTDYIDEKTGAVIFGKDSPNRRAIAEMHVTQFGEGEDAQGCVTKIKFRDPTAAAERVSKLLGLDKPPPPEKKEFTFRVVRGEDKKDD